VRLAGGRFRSLLPLEVSVGIGGGSARIAKMIVGYVF
jgi:hypothetical protein